MRLLPSFLSPSRLLLAFALALTLGGSTAGAAPPSPSPPAFGPNVTVFDPSMPVSQIQAAVDAIYAQQVNDEMARGATRSSSSRASMDQPPSRSY